MPEFTEGSVVPQPQGGKHCIVSLMTEVMVKSSKGPYLLARAMQGVFDHEQGVFVADVVFDLEGDHHTMPVAIRVGINLTTITAIQFLPDKR